MREGVVWLWLLLGMGAAAAGCFNPDKPACAFSCAEAPHTCPASFVCRPDGLCHDPSRPSGCRIEVVDGATSDANGGATGDTAATQ